MPSIVTLIKESQLFRIGTNLRQLGSLEAEVKAAATPTDKENVEAIKLSYRTSNGEGSAEMTEICNGLSMSEITENGGTWSAGPQIGPNNSGGIEGLADVKFVFEKENEKIVVIPHKNALNFAFQNPPLEEGDYVVDFAWKAMAVFEAAVRTKFSTHPVLNGQAQQIMEVIEATIRQDYPAPDGDKEAVIYYEQLGGYTCRQCG